MNKLTLPKEYFRLKDIQSINFGTKYRDKDLWLISSITYYSGRTERLFETKLTDLNGKPEPKEDNVSIMLPPAEAWKLLELGKLKLDKLTIGLLGQKAPPRE